jgi:hypothetical protein
MKRVVPTPLGMAGLEIARSERHFFVTVTAFGEDGWATGEEIWGSHEESLPTFLTRLTGMPRSQADEAAEDLLGDS